MLKIFAARLEFCDFRIGRLNSEKSSACIRAGADELLAAPGSSYDVPDVGTREVPCCPAWPGLLMQL